MAKAKKSNSIDMSGHSYRRVRVVGADGRSRHSATNDDAVARAMLTFAIGGGDWDKVIRDNKLTEKYPKGAKGYANPGLFRMTLGGTLRAKVRAGTPVKIGTIIVKTLEQRVADPSADRERPARKAPKPKTTPRKRKAKAVAPEAEAA